MLPDPQQLRPQASCKRKGRCAHRVLRVDQIIVANRDGPAPPTGQVTHPRSKALQAAIFVILAKKSVLLIDAILQAVGEQPNTSIAGSNGLLT